MSGKSLQQLTTAELYSECTARRISMSDSKQDVVSGLRTIFGKEDRTQCQSIDPVNQHIGRTGYLAGRFPNASRHERQSDFRSAVRGYFDKPYSKSKTYGQPVRILRLSVDHATGTVRTSGRVRLV